MFYSIFSRSLNPESFEIKKRKSQNFFITKKKTSTPRFPLLLVREREREREKKRDRERERERERETERDRERARET